MKCVEATKSLNSGKIVMNGRTDTDVRYCISQLSTAIQRKQPLPNLLFCGPAGVGKSTLAQLVAAMTSVPVTVLSGNDLLSLGNQGGLYLRTVLQECVTKKRITVILIEDADVIIKSRKSTVAVTAAPESSILRNSHSSSRSIAVPPALNCCLYALLEGIRESSPYFSIVMTSRLASTGVDSAVLDRMDSTIELPLPTAAQRLYFTKLVFESEFMTLLDREDQQLYRQTINGLNQDQLYLHCSSLTSSIHSRDQTSPETDCPDAVGSSTTTSISDTSVGANVDGSVSFNAGVSFLQLMNISEGWSYRDIKKFLMSTRFSVLANDRCMLTSNIWVKEVAFHSVK